MSAPGINAEVKEAVPSATPARGRHRRLYLLAALLSLVGLGDAIYLTVKHLTGQSVRCTISNGCDAVLASAYASVAGFPLAAFGALAYFAAFSLATLAIFGYRGARTFLLIVVGLMTLMTLRLVYLQAFVLHAYCEFCLLSAIITLSLAGLMLYSLFATETQRHGEEKK